MDVAMLNMREKIDMIKDFYRRCRRSLGTALDPNMMPVMEIGLVEMKTVKLKTDSRRRNNR